MKMTMLAVMLAATLVPSTPAHADDRRLIAADIPGVGLHKRGIVISNSGDTISAYRFFDNVKESLVTLRSSRSLHATSYGDVLYNSSATLSVPMPQYLSSAISDAARQHGVDPRLVAAVATRESAFNPAAVSPVGACGVMQLMPATAKYLGITDIFDVRQNVFAGTRYLRTLLDTFHGDLDLTLAAYNAGPGAVAKYNGVPPYRETQKYVKVVRASYERALVASR